MRESIVKIGNEHIFVRHNEIKPDRKSILFVHGLGESGLCFQEAFEEERLENYNLLVPDMVGYGKSSGGRDNDYSFKSQVKRLWTLLAHYEVKDMVAVGHSLGGDITTVLCATDKKGVIKKYVNVEGDITQHDLFISYNALDAEKEGRIKEWFENDFLNTKVYEKWGQNLISCRRYFASLWFCQPDAFMENAHELVKRNNSLDGEFKSEIGQIYASLKIPKVYCCGSDSISKSTIKFLKQNNLQYKNFKDASHWLMIDKSKEFYSFLASFVKNDKVMKASHDRQDDNNPKGGKKAGKAPEKPLSGPEDVQKEPVGDNSEEE